MVLFLSPFSQTAASSVLFSCEGSSAEQEQSFLAHRFLRLPFSSFCLFLKIICPSHNLSPLNPFKKLIPGFPKTSPAPTSKIQTNREVLRQGILYSASPHCGVEIEAPLVLLSSTQTPVFTRPRILVCIWSFLSISP